MSVMCKQRVEWSKYLTDRFTFNSAVPHRLQMLEVDFPLLTKLSKKRSWTCPRRQNPLAPLTEAPEVINFDIVR